MRTEELRDWLVQALEQLPVEQRLAVELCYELGYSCEEISAIMGCPVNTVKTRCFTRVQSCRSCFPFWVVALLLPGHEVGNDRF